MTLILVTGPARSGKSEWAESLAVQSAKPVTYVATAQRNASDVEWDSRIERHRQRRPADWRTLEAPTNLAEVLVTATQLECLLVDSLGTWLVNYLETDDKAWEAEVARLLESVARSPAHIIVVAEETGWGVVPAYPLGRQFRDRLGMLTRQLGAIAQTVYLVTGGYALDLSRLGTPLPSPASPHSADRDIPEA